MSRKFAFVMLALMAAFLLTSTDALAARVRCKVSPCYGTELADAISGTQKADTIFGLGGNDEIVGNLGNDTLDGGDGNDLIFGESGADILNGGKGNDRMFGHDGRDSFIGGDGDDFIDAVFFEEAFPESDFVNCGAGFDTVKADRFDSVLSNCEKVIRV